MFRVTRPISILLKSTYKSTTNIAALINIHKYSFGGHMSPADINHPHINPSPGQDHGELVDDNPYLWDPSHMPCEDSDYYRPGINPLYDYGHAKRHAIDGNDTYSQEVLHGDELKTSILNRITKIVKLMERAQTDDKSVTLNTHLYNDLGLDSLDQVEFGLALEDEFDIEIPDDEAEQIVTIGDAVDLISEYTNAV